MAELRDPVFDRADAIDGGEDEATLAAIDRAIKAADEGRLVSLDQVRQHLREWSTKSSSPKTRSTEF